MKPFINSFLIKISFVALLFFCSATFVSAQNKDSKGTDFWLMFPGNFFGGGEVTLFISGDANTSGTVTIPGLGFSQSFTVTVGSVTSIALPVDVNAATSDFIEDKGIHVTAQDEVTVYGLNRIQFTTDAFLGLPTDVLGTNYINLGYLNSDIVNGTQFGLVATENNTEVTITPVVETDGHAANVPYTITLNQGQTYLLRNTGSFPSDLTGSSIESNKPIAVFGGHQCANIPPGAFACDYVVEELPPTNTWGKNFVTVPLKTRLNGDTFRFLASEDGTEVTVNGSVVANLNKGENHEMIITESSQITSNNPILVAQYSNGTTYDNVTSDPFMMLISPFEQFLGDYTITTPASGFAGNYVNVVAPNSAIGSVKLDGVAIPASDFTAIGSSGFSGAQEDIGLGVHTVNGTSQRFGVFVYGFDQADSYGYPGGQAFAKIADVFKLSLTPASGSAPVNTNQCFTALVQDQNNQPVVGVPVDFKILGANGGVNGTQTTNADGKAEFCYDGPIAGLDTIVATQAALNDTSFFTRTEGPNDDSSNICLRDNFHYRWQLRYLRQGKVRNAHGYVRLEEGVWWEAYGYFNYENGKIELHAINPTPDGCNSGFTDSFTYKGKGGGYYDPNKNGNPFFGASGNWKSYCGGSVYQTGTFSLVDCDHESQVPKLNNFNKAPARAVNNNMMALKVSPNPTRGNTTITYSVSQAGKVSLIVYDYLMQPVKVLANNVKTKGNYSIAWDGRKSNGTDVLPGVYKAVAVINGKSYSTSIQIIR